MIPGISQNRLAMVVPTLNEAGNIDTILSALTDALRDTQYENEYEIVVVDDGSTDGTVEKARDWAKRDSRIRFLSRAGERGLAGAVLYGWSQCRGNLLGVIDADLQHPPALLPKLLEAAETSDIAIASRYSRNHGVKGWNPIRAAVSRLSTLAAAPLISKKNLGVTDPMSGFFIIHRRCIEGLTFQSAGFKLLLEILVRGRIKTAREVPYNFGLRQAGRSKANPTVAFHYLHLLGRLSREMVVRSTAP
jgi:dolichol-phosphate mannosyltransferase